MHGMEGRLLYDIERTPQVFDAVSVVGAARNGYSGLPANNRIAGSTKISITVYTMETEAYDIQW